MPETTEIYYGEESIKTLSALEHIRLRPGMYIGRLGDGSHPEDGIYILLKEIIDNSIDEFIMGAGKKIEVNLDPESGKTTIRDYGRGIPLFNRHERRGNQSRQRIIQLLQSPFGTRR